MFNVPHLVLRYYCTIWGYVLGSKFIQTSYENGLIHHMTKLATVIGLTTVGAMIATLVSLNVGLTCLLYTSQADGQRSAADNLPARAERLSDGI